MNILKKISDNKIFKKRPIVLMHIGSAGSTFNNWKNIAQNSILISVDGTSKDANFKNKFKKTVNSKSIISNKNEKRFFYITKDSDCSSLLMPNKNILKEWYFFHRFKIKKKTLIKVISINNFLKKNKINYIDWLIIDAQGVDLKILKSLNKKILNNISILDLEPGFLEFYQNADKISDIFKFMSKNFGLEDMKFGTNFHLPSSDVSYFEKKILFSFNKPSKTYTNITFLNNKKSNERINFMKLIYLFNEDKIFEARNYLKKNISKSALYENVKIVIKNKIILKKVRYILLFPFIFLKKIFHF